MKKQFSFLSLFLIVFIGLLGVSIVIPILAPLFLNENSMLFSVSVSFETRAILLGLLMGVYPFAQFLGAPILGAWSDSIGRKPMLLLSVFGTLISQILFAFAIIQGNLWLMFVSRALDGFTGGNISIVYSAIADVSDQHSKAKNFGLIGMAFGFGFILGPFLGGVLSDPSVLPWFNSAVPFYLAAFLSLIDIILIIFYFQETLMTPKTQKLSIWMGVHNVMKAFRYPHLRAIFIVIFLLGFGFTFFTQFFQVYLIELFDFTEKNIGLMFAYIGLWVALTQGVLMRPLVKRYLPRQILPWSLVLLSLAFLFLMLPQNPWWLLIIMPFIAIFHGMSQPNTVAMVSNMTDNAKQGEILGINQSIASLALAIPPIIGGFVVAMNIYLPIIGAAIFIAGAWLVFVVKFR